MLAFDIERSTTMSDRQAKVLSVLHLKILTNGKHIISLLLD